MFSLPKLGVQNNESTPALTSLIPSSQKDEGSVRTAEPATDEENVADEVVELLNPELNQPVISNGEDGYKKTSTVPPLLVPDVQWILHPDSVGMIRWTRLISLATVIDCVLTPVGIAWAIEDETWNGFMIIFDLLFLLHVFVTLRCALWESMELVVDGYEIAMKYCKLWIWIDLLPCMPWDLLFGSLGYVALIRFLRLFRIMRIMKVVLSQATNPFIVLGKLVIYVLILGHWLGCAWWMIAEEDNRFGPSSELKRNEVFALQYLESLYWGLGALGAIGAGFFPETYGENLFCVVICLVGSFVFAYILGEVFNVIQVINAPGARYAQLMGELEAYIAHKRILPATGDRLLRWQATEIERTNGLDETDILARIPYYLRQEVCAQQVGRFMQNSILGKFPKEFQDTVVMYLKSEVFGKGDYLIKQSDVGANMFFIESGQVDILVGGNLVATLGPGNCVGETALLERALRTATAQAKTRVMVYSLMADHFHYIVSFHHRAKLILDEMALKRRNDRILASLKTALSDSVANAQLTNAMMNRCFVRMKCRFLESVGQARVKDGDESDPKAEPQLRSTLRYLSRVK